jgi:hypothetical protein
MKNILSFAVCLALANATPLTPRFPSTGIIFHGAAGAEYGITVPLNGIVTPTNNDLSISSITATSDIDIGAQCGFQTVDSPPPVLVEGPPGTWVVGPPQSVISVYCYLAPPPPTTIEIEFDGAADAKNTLTVPLDGTYTPTSKLSSKERNYEGLRRKR